MPRRPSMLPAGTPKTAPEDLARITDWVTRLEPLLATLKARWADEHEYEDLQEYALPIRTTMPEGFTLVAMQAKPFGCTFQIGTDALYAVTMTAREYGWERLR